jgi:hypothetical protein
VYPFADNRRLIPDDSIKKPPFFRAAKSAI